MGMNARQILSSIVAKAGARNYGARAGETIAGNLVRGANGKFAAGGGGASAASDTESADPKEVASVLKRLLAASKPDKAAKGGKATKPKAPLKGKKPPKEKKDAVKVGRGRDAEQDAKRTAIISKLPIPAADKATLTAIINGEKVKSGALSGLIKAGLVQVRGDGSFELTGIANALARAKEGNDMSKFDSAKRALKQAYAAIKSAEKADDEVVVEAFDVDDEQLAAIAGVLGVSYAKEIDGAMSFEEIRERVNRALREQYGKRDESGYINGVWVLETYLSEVVVDMQGKVYRIGYSIDRDGDVTVEAREKWVQVERVSSWQAVAKGDIDADDEAKPLAFIASGAYGPDTDGEWMSEAMLASVAKAVNDGKLPMTIDIWHVGFPSAKNPKPKAAPVIVGSVSKAEVINSHLVLTPTFESADDEAVVRAAKDDLQLSVYFAGAISKGNDGAINGVPSRASVAILPRGKAAYKYSAVLG